MRIPPTTSNIRTNFIYLKYIHIYFTNKTSHIYFTIKTSLPQLLKNRCPCKMYHIYPVASSILVSNTQPNQEQDWMVSKASGPSQAQERSPAEQAAGPMAPSAQD